MSKFAMASAELDPLFVKALKLMNSRSKDSTEQLKQMLDEVLAQKRSELSVKKEPDSFRDDSKSGKSFIKKEYSDITKKRESEKRNIDKLKADLLDLSHDVPLKKVKLEPGVSSSSSSQEGSTKSTSERDRERGRDSRDVKDKIKERSSSNRDRERDRDRDRDRDRIRESDKDGGSTGREKERDSEREDRDRDRERDRERTRERDRDERDRDGDKPRGREKEGRRVFQITSDSSAEESGDNDDKAQSMDTNQFELVLGDLACVVCKRMDVTAINGLVECQECHSLYHQECHRPPVTENINDPRFVWYCYKCSKNMKRMVSKPQKTKTSGQPLNKELLMLKASKTEPSLLQPFKRFETKPSSGREPSSSSGGARPFSGLAGLAANLSSRPSLDVNKSIKTESGGKQSASTPKRFDDPKFNPFGTLFKPDPVKITGGSSSSSSGSKGDHSRMATYSSSVSVKTEPKTGSSSISSSSSGVSSKIPTSKNTSSSGSGSGPGAGSGSASSSSSKLHQSSSMMNAEKRLQLVKKKAAAKLHDKKK